MFSHITQESQEEKAGAGESHSNEETGPTKSVPSRQKALEPSPKFVFLCKR